MTIKIIIRLLLFTIVSLMGNCAFADTPVSLFQSYAGNVNFVGAEATRRTQSNAGDSCAILSANTTNTATVTGIPASATIRSAHLYWAGSFSTQAGSTRTTPDYSVVFEGGVVTAPVNRQYTANYTIGTTSLDFYSGVADVTAQVIVERNGVYSFSGLSVNNGATTQHCTRAAVTAGWSLVIIYEAATEDFRVVNLFEGFQAFRGQSFTLIPDNFRIPTSPINGKHAHITWEGDPGNSATFNGNTERLLFNGNTLTDAANPNNNQFNSTSTIASIAPSTGATNFASHGVDYDAYNIGAFLTAGQTSATSTYSSGGDLVLLSSEIISVTNTPVSDLGISKTASSSFNVGQNATYDIVVNNAGPNIEPGNIVVTDTLPAGLSYVSAIGTGWACGATGQNVSCTRTGNLVVGASASTITLTVAVSTAAAPSVSNTANVSGTNFDNVSGNNTNSDTVAVATAPVLSLQKTAVTLSDPINNTTNPKSIPGAIREYTITATNSGGSATDNNTIVINDAIPANTEYVVNSLQFIDGTTPTSGLSTSPVAPATSIYSYSTDGTNYSTSQSPAVTHIRVSPSGQFLAPSGSGIPLFQVTFQVQVQ